MTNWTSLSVTETTLERIRETQPEEMSRDAFVNDLLDNYEGATDAPMQESMQVEIDADEIMDQLRDELSELLTIQVDVDLSDESDLSEEDVKRIVRDHIERSVHERARNL